MKILNPQKQNQHPGKPGPGGQNVPGPSSKVIQPNQHPGKPGPGGQNVPSKKPSNIVTPKKPVAKPNSKKPRAKTRDMLNIEFLLRKTFQFIVRSAALYIMRGTKKSNHFENKILYKVTKHILSNTNVNERDHFFDVFSKTFGAP